MGLVLLIGAVGSMPKGPRGCGETKDVGEGGVGGLCCPDDTACSSVAATMLAKLSAETPILL